MYDNWGWVPKEPMRVSYDKKKVSFNYPASSDHQCEITNMSIKWGLPCCLPILLIPTLIMNGLETLA